jgi:3'-phosphoadenosine 5'-phosphosulfate sulfotransferase (PAPS reductase)/FAD synthetase
MTDTLRCALPDCSRPAVLSYGGGTQTAAMCVLVANGLLPRPDYIIAADTGREVQSTWDYLSEIVEPLLARIGLTVEIAPHSLSTVDLYAKNGDLLLPVFTETGKLPTFCSTEWKARVVQRYLRQTHGVSRAVQWIGFSQEERSRVPKSEAPGPWQRTYPLLDLMLTRSDCEQIILGAGLPLPHKSACYMCPHRSNAEWREVRDRHPEQFAEAVRIDHEIREADERGAVYLHRALVPLDEIDLDAAEPRSRVPERQCGLGMCFV